MVNSALWFSAWFGGKFRSKRTFASAQEKGRRCQVSWRRFPMKMVVSPR
ncbi:hypothetical protein A676_00027 [Salmonella enterica subsp. enterica serovar Enteritidis str. 2010K-0262]|uniref:Uncharacterized protein n=1 Tax=Salmonella enterica subsp. enterica serovar Dublin str. UC16 TaxID=1192688 RepID=M7S3V1_SALDU|nr:hypothetical protein A670_01887 [Salmonella enterica subsp. enterica serovar Dublin str. UC16]EPI91645.1 hypothetical protein A676_00027 [Salmonella enterica subsp. enterica serovar Enteritidis str. 2010K-0262]EPI92000.1 hypothetical protein A675_00775 [Salmonella enterica subsp. enterica serovar Enteritidis str. 2009K1726]EPI97873.1 hypothetical protein A677_03044 [Salmonella enterica subsp. enterica serovar Enteritidis str. 2010K-0267]